MGLRIVEVVLAKEVAQYLKEPLEGVEVEGIWQEDLDQGLALVRILVRSEETEKLLDFCSRRYGELAEFKTLVLEVQAVLPRREEDAPAAGTIKGAQNEKTPGRISREELYTSIEKAARINGVFITLVALSSLVAAMGLLSANLAVIIGAMVIAPLLGPNTALSLAVVLGDASLAARSAKTLVLGVGLALLLAWLLGLALGVDPSSPELAGRAQATLGSLVLALASGAAGALAFTSGISSALVGVMVAVALLPPLTACGLFVAGGYTKEALGAGLLFLVNLAAVNFAGVVVFFIQKIKPRSPEDAPQARRMTLVFSAGWLIVLGIIIAALIRDTGHWTLF